MARTTGTRSVKDLLDEGILQTGNVRELARRSAPTLRASVRSDGQLDIGGQMITTPSKAAQVAMDSRRPIDGWKRWKVTRLGERTLAEIRDSSRS